MNAEKLKKDIGRAAELAQSIHDEMVDIFTDTATEEMTLAQALEIISGLATLKWYLEYIGEGVSA